MYGVTVVLDTVDETNCTAQLEITACRLVQRKLKTLAMYRLCPADGDLSQRMND